MPNPAVIAAVWPEVRGAATEPDFQWVGVWCAAHRPTVGWAGATCPVAPQRSHGDSTVVYSAMWATAQAGLPAILMRPPTAFLRVDSLMLNKSLSHVSTFSSGQGKGKIASQFLFFNFWIFFKLFLPWVPFCTKLLEDILSSRHFPFSQTSLKLDDTLRIYFGEHWQTDWHSETLRDSVVL